MIIGVGIDVVDVARFMESLTRSPGLVERVFTETERHVGPASLAARFAAKEAVAKALGAPGGLRWHDCEILTADTGQPRLVIQGTVAARAAELGIGSWHVSLSHDAGIASAVVIAES
ncbi:MAG TPA: holo-ACP synthase [Actinomycetes bacterium]|nr:holo-ACP synthase [Actinomycetes bacterium]